MSRKSNYHRLARKVDRESDREAAQEKRHQDWVNSIRETAPNERAALIINSREGLSVFHMSPTLRNELFTEDQVSDIAKAYKAHWDAIIADDPNGSMKIMFSSMPKVAIPFIKE